MARTREMIRSLRNDLFYRLVRLDAVREHDCYTFLQSTTECALCVLVGRGRLYSLALGQFVREAGLIPRELCVEEIALIEIVGKERYKRMVDAEIQAFMFGPILSCENCGNTFKWLTTRNNLRAAFLNKKVQFYCPKCNYRITRTAEDEQCARLLKVQKKRGNKNKQKEDWRRANQKLRELFAQAKTM